jgi:hypothetical protein
LDDAHLLVDTALANAMYAMHATFHSGLMTTPGALSFSCDMVMNIPFVADLTLIHDNHQRLIDEQVICTNVRRHSHDFQPGQEVWKLVFKPDKLEPCAQSPYDIIAVHSNGTRPFLATASGLIDNIYRLPGADMQLDDDEKDLHFV